MTSGESNRRRSRATENNQNCEVLIIKNLPKKVQALLECKQRTTHCGRVFGSGKVPGLLLNGRNPITRFVEKANAESSRR